MKRRKIILGSGSPRRSQLLQWAEVDFEVIISDIEENFPAHLSPAEVAIHIAAEKATAVKKKCTAPGSGFENRPILAADTIVVLNGEIIGKPSSRDEAVKILSRLSGNTHEVITGICILSGEKKIVFPEQTGVEFYDLSPEQISHYVENYKPYDKAGAYAIQEWIGVVGIKSITGDFYNVMGLPVSRVVRALKNL